MQKFLTLVVAGLLLAMFAQPAQAARVEDVVAACDKMAAEKPGSCNYTTDDKGLGGCTRNGCFYCPADGSRQCHATRVGGGNKASIVTLGKIEMKCSRRDEGWCK
jgi:hypothetical protein